MLTSASVFLSFIVFVIYSKNNFRNGLEYKGISAILFLLSLRFFTIHLYINHLIEVYPHFLLINNLTSRIGVPILFFVVIFSLNPRKFKAYDLVHLALPVLFIVHFSNVFFGSVSFKLDLIREMDQFGYDLIWEIGILNFPGIILFLKYLSIYAYTVVILFLLFRSGNLKKLPGHLLTFFKLAAVFLVVNLLPTLIPTFIPQLGIDVWKWLSLIGATSTVVTVIGLFLIPDFIYKKEAPFISTPTSFSGIELQDGEDPVSSSAVRTKEDQLFQKIDSFFRQEKPFLDPDLSLNHLERQFGISGRYMSEAIKEMTGMNFSNYVNQARVDYFTDHFVYQDHALEKKVDEIAFDIGFKNGTTFHQFFRKVKGCTPKEFIRNRLEELASKGD